ncbi:MAG: hypothetical protein M3Z05_03510 [Gemmatimonadota bacterium]|nr:hypothetical protein [Gemmatimonadota bacterium]
MSSATESRYTLLRDRYAADGGGDDRSSHAMVVTRLERALDAIGWRSANGASSEEVAADAVHVIADCVNRHHDVSRAADALADLLYRSAASLDGSMYAASAFLPAAEEVLSRYSKGQS